MARSAGLGEKRRSNNETVERSVRRLEKDVSKEIVRRKDQAPGAAKLLPGGQGLVRNRRRHSTRPARPRMTS
jgi:hypothetical protein